MAIKLFENISSVQNVPAATSDTPRDRYKPISLYLVGAGTGEWKVTVSYSPVNSSVYKKLGPVFTLSVSNTNPFQLFSWDYDCDSFVAWVSEIKGNATATLWMTQGNARNLDYLLMTEPTARLKADPTDIPNCSLEYTPDGWVGGMGVFSSYSALQANPTNALVQGKVWAVVASADSVAKWNYMSAGWVVESSVGTTGASNLPGTPANPFATVNERDAAMPAGVPRRECYMLNAFAPLAPGVPGLVKWIDTGASWILAPEQILANYANADGSPILDTTASALGLTPGIFAEIWTSPVLPLWLLEGGYRSFFVEVNRANLTGNTSQTTITASIRGASATPSIYDNMLTHQQANSSAWRGPSVLGTQFRKVGGNLVGVEGPNQLAQREGNKWVGSYVENNTRIRIGYTAGASSDLILIHSAVIKNGVC